MKSVVLILFLSVLLLAVDKNTIISDKDILFSISDKNYTASIFPNSFKKLPLSKQKYYISRFLYYKLFLDKLKPEQKKYNKEIKASFDKREKEFNKKGVVLDELDKFLEDKRLVLKTIAYQKALSKHKDLDKEAKEFYEKHKKGYMYPDRVEIAHIVLKDKNTTQKVLAELKKSPNDIKLFAKLAKEYSLDKKNKKMGGYVGEIFEKSVGKDNFVKLWKAKEGTIFPEPIEQKGYKHIIYIFKKSKNGQRTYQQEQDSIKEYLLKKDISKWKRDEFKKIKDKSDVKFYKIKL